MFITIDPGSQGTGYAIWQKGWFLFHHGVITPQRRKSWVHQVLDIVRIMHGIQVEYEIQKAFVEYPALFQSAGGMVTARSGALVKLSFTAGALCGVFREFDIVKVNTWKGQLPKDIIESRIKRLLPERAWKGAKSHAWDAIGIGLYLKGVL